MEVACYFGPIFSYMHYLYQLILQEYYHCLYLQPITYDPRLLVFQYYYEVVPNKYLYSLKYSNCSTHEMMQMMEQIGVS